MPRWALALVGVGEEAGGFDDDLGADGGPVELGGVALGEDLDGLAVDGDGVSPCGDVVLEVAEDGVVLEQVGEGGGGGEVVDGDEFDVGIAERGAEDIASDAAEAVDANLDCHVRAFSLWRLCCESVRVVRFEGITGLACIPTIDATQESAAQESALRRIRRRFIRDFRFRPNLRRARTRCVTKDPRYARMDARTHEKTFEAWTERFGVHWKIGQEIPANQPAPLRPTYPERACRATDEAVEPDEFAARAGLSLASDCRRRCPIER